MYQDLIPETMTVTLQETPDQHAVNALSESLETLPGARLADVNGAQITIEYYREITTDSLVEKAIKDAGATIVIPQKKGVLKRTLERMAENNRKTFGSGSLDCCGLNKNSQRANSD